MPEENKHNVNVVPVEQQLVELRRKLAGNQSFGKCREAGQFGRIPIYKLLEQPNPTATLKALDDSLSDQRVMLNMLAILKREGNMYAYQELLDALTEGHVITGEELPLEKTEPGVLVMVDPEKALLLARWMYTSEFSDAIHWIRHGHGDPKRGQCGSLTPKLLEIFPHLREQFLEQENQSHRLPPTYVIEERVKDVWEKLDQYRGNRFPIFVVGSMTGMWYGSHCSAIFVSGVDQQDVLSLFSREEQKSIATWRFNFPKTVKRMMGPSSDMWLGLHSEAEHQNWKSRWPSYVSCGVACGLGATILDSDMLKKGICPKENGLSGYTTFEHVHPDYIKGDLEHQRLVFTFPSR